MLVFVRVPEFPGRTFVITTKYDERVGVLKAKLYDILDDMGRNDLRYTLVFQGQLLWDSQTLSDYQIYDKSLLDVTPLYYDKEELIETQVEVPIDADEDDGGPGGDRRKGSDTRDWLNLLSLGRKKRVADASADSDADAAPGATKMVTKTVKRTTWLNVENNVFEGQLQQAVTEEFLATNDRDRLTEQVKWFTLAHWALGILLFFSSFWWMGLWMAVALLGFYGAMRHDRAALYVYISLCAALVAIDLIAVLYLDCDEFDCTGGRRLYTLVLISVTTVVFGGAAYHAHLLRANLNFNFEDAVDEIFFRAGRLRSFIFLARSSKPAVRREALSLLLKVMQSSEEGKSRLVAEGVVPALVAVCLESEKNRASFEAVAQIINELADVENMRESMIQQGIMTAIAVLFAHRVLGVVQNTVQAVAKLSMCETERDTIGTAPTVLATLIELLGARDLMIKEGAAAALANLSSTENNGARIRQLDGIKSLITVAYFTIGDCQVYAARSLVYLSMHETLKTSLVAGGVMHPVSIWAAQPGREDLQGYGASIVAYLCAHPEAARQVVAAGVVELITRHFLMSPTASVLCYASNTVARLASDPDLRPQIMSAGVPQLLQSLVRHEDPTVKAYAEQAIAVVRG